MKKVLLALSLVAVLASCKKDKEDGPITPTKENLTGSYKMTAATMTSSGQTVDIFNNDMFFEACMRDDVYTLNADLTYDATDAGTQCDPANNYEGTWSLVNTTTFRMDGDDYTIKSWNGKTLVVEITEPGFGTFSSTYVKQ